MKTTAIVSNNGSSLAARLAGAARAGILFLGVDRPAPRRPEPFPIPVALATERVIRSAAWGAEVDLGGGAKLRRGRDRWYHTGGPELDGLGRFSAGTWVSVTETRAAWLCKAARGVAVDQVRARVLARLVK